MRKVYFLIAVKTVFFLLFFICFKLYAGTLELKEKYMPDQTSADFTTGKVGNAVGIWAQEPLVYPVVFTHKDVSEITISFWFRPARRYLSQYDVQRIFSLSDGKSSIDFVLNGEGLPFPKRRLYFPGGHFDNIGEEESKVFNHILYTWKKGEAAFYFNGKQVYSGGKLSDLDILLDGSRTFLYLSAPHVVWFDEVLILDRYTSPEEAIRMYQEPSQWKIDKHTSFYTGFESNIAGIGYLDDNGDVVRMISYIGRIEATFKADDIPEFYFTVINTGKALRNLSLKGIVKDLNRKIILEKEYPVSVESGKSTVIKFDMKEIKENGLFWGYFTLVEKDKKIDAETIPFARTLMVNRPRHTGEEITTGLVVPQGFAPDYVQWVLVYHEYWENHELSPGEFYFERLDLKINNLVRTGRNPVIMLSTPPEWYKRKYRNTATLEGYYYPDTDDKEAMDIWKRYVHALGERYKGKVFDYEVFGEAYFRSDARHYGNLVNITKEVLAEVDPRIRVACNMGGNHIWAKRVAEITAGKADYYTIHPYIWVNGAVSTLKDEEYAAQYIAFLKEAGAKVNLANTEYGTFTLLSLGIDKDGYPLTKQEFERAGLWDTWAPQLKARGRDAFVDWHTAAFRAVRGVTLNNVLGCRYEMWWTSGTGGGIADLKFKPYTPSTLSVAYANASALFSGYSYVQRIILGGSDLIKAYLFRKGNEYMLVFFTDDDHEDRVSTVYMELIGENIEILDIYGNKQSIEFIGNIARFNFRANNVFYVRGITEIPKVSRPVVSAEIINRDVFPGRKITIKASLYNPLTEDITGRVSLSFPSSFEKVAPQQVILMPKEFKEYTFEVNIPSCVRGEQAFETVFETGTKKLGEVVYHSILPIRTSVIAEYVRTAPVIDGKLNEWGDVDKFPIKINQPAQVIMGTPYTESYIPRIDWKGPQDLSGFASIKYDDFNLYVAVRVYDNIVMNPYGWTPSLANNADCIELFIDGRTMDEQGNDTYTEDVFRIIFAPAVKEFPVPFYFIASPDQKNLPRRPISGMVFSSEKLVDGYIMEIKIPFSNFRFKPSDVRSGNSIGFDIALVDRDEETEKQKGMSMLLWGGKKEGLKNPVYFGRILFGGISEN